MNDWPKVLIAIVDKQQQQQQQQQQKQQQQQIDQCRQIRELADRYQWKRTNCGGSTHKQVRANPVLAQANQF